MFFFLRVRDVRSRRRGRAPTSPISPRHVRAHKAPRPVGGQCAARGWPAARCTSRGEATRTAKQGAAGAGAAVPSRSSSAVLPRLLRNAWPTGVPSTTSPCFSSGLSSRHTSAPSFATPGGGGPPAQLYTSVLPSLEAMPHSASTTPATVSRAKKHAWLQTR